MKKLKYIIADGSPILFGEATRHKDVARGFNVTSAGFVHISKQSEDHYKATCFGESESLGIKSKPEEDSRNIEFMINYY